VAQQLLDELDEIKNGKKRYCQRCNKLITTRTKYCDDCLSIVKEEKALRERRAERPSRDELK